jgi:ornithine carbamoyltransferase
MTQPLMTRHFLELSDLSPTDLTTVLDLSERADPPQVLAGKGMALLFEKPSARTRNSVEMAVVQLGGHPVTMRGDEVGLDVRESCEDVARTLSCYHHAIGARVFEHGKLERLAAASSVPVVNLLSDRSHPIQALADLLTIRQHVGRLEDVTLAYVGDGNNMAHALAQATELCSLHMRVSSPPGYRLEEAAKAELVDDPAEAVRGADVVYTDTWFSMGQEAEAAKRRPLFAPWRVTAELLALAAPDAIFLHCLPAHRGDEVVDDVLDGRQSRIWPQAANRMHTTRGLLAFLLGGS